MTSDGSRRRGSAAPGPPDPIAELLAALHGRGFLVGPDDAVRVAAVFRHARGWSQGRRVRALKALLGRTDEERLVLEQLAPLLFVHAPLEATGAEPSVRTARAAEPVWQPTRRTGGDVEERRKPAGRRTGGRRRGILVVVFGLVAVLAIVLSAEFLGSEGAGEPGAGPGLGDSGPGMPDLPPSGGSGQAVEPAASKMFDPLSGPTPVASGDPLSPCDPEPVPVWPGWVAAGLSLAWTAAAFATGLVARRRRRHVEALRDSAGPRTFRLDVPPDRAGGPLPAAMVREAAFHLSAPATEAPAPWVDGQQTVESTTRLAGRLDLRYGSWREHRPVLFLEDVSPSMARWPDHGRQIALALAVQGGEVSHRFMDGLPVEVSTERDLTGAVPLETVLADLGEAGVVILGDASALDASGPADPPWLGLLAGATWLCPRPVELWGPGARRLSSRLRMVPLGDEGTLRLGNPRGETSGCLGPRWRPPRIAGSHPGSLTRAYRAALGEEAFWWLAAGAVLDRIDGLTARAWWALRADGVVPAPWDRLERVWDLPEVRVGADGVIVLSETLRDALLADLDTERPDLRTAIVAWAEEVLIADLRRLDPCCLAAVTARTQLARLLGLESGRAADARRLRRALVAEGCGAILAGCASEDERLAWGGGRPRTVRRGSAMAAAAGILVLGMAGTFLASEDVREAVWPRSPEIVFPGGEPRVLWKGRPLVFCDRGGALDEARVEVSEQASDGREHRASLSVPAAGDDSGRRVWRIETTPSGSDSPPFAAGPDSGGMWIGSPYQTPELTVVGPGDREIGRWSFRLAPDPVDVAMTWLRALAACDFQTAREMLTEETRGLFDAKELEGSCPYLSGFGRSAVLEIMADSSDIARLRVRIGDEFSETTVILSARLEDNAWKITYSPSRITSVIDSWKQVVTIVDISDPVTPDGFAELKGIKGGVRSLKSVIDHELPQPGEAVRVIVVVGAMLPRSGGKVDREAVESVVKRRKGAIQYCYERTLKVNPTVSGRITLEYTLGTGGTVVRIDTVENSTGDTHLVECMADRIRQWPFPPTENGTMTFRQSFLFRTSDEASQYIKYKSKEPESTTPVLYTGTYSVSGELDRETVRRYVMTKTSHMARCYQDEMEKRGDLGEGMVKVGWIISPTGKVTGAYIVDTTLHDPAVERCMIDRVSTWLFPSPKGGVSVRVGFPFIFKRK